MKKHTDQNRCKMQLGPTGEESIRTLTVSHHNRNKDGTINLRQRFISAPDRRGGDSEVKRNKTVTTKLTREQALRLMNDLHKIFLESTPAKSQEYVQQTQCMAGEANMRLINHLSERISGLDDENEQLSEYVSDLEDRFTNLELAFKIESPG